MDKQKFPFAALSEVRFTPQFTAKCQGCGKRRKVTGRRIASGEGFCSTCDSMLSLASLDYMIYLMMKYANAKVDADGSH